MDLRTQLDTLRRILMASGTLCAALERARSFGPLDYYIGAGCVTQTVWNHMSGNPPGYGIKDIDFVFFDAAHTDYDFENDMIRKVKDLFNDLAIETDVKNQARVHLWYRERFGYSIEPYASLEAAINTWPTTATAIGVRLGVGDELVVYAPFGLNDLFGKIVRANKKQITEEIYKAKVSRWLEKWPDLTVIPWEE